MITPLKSKNLFHLCKRKSIDAFEMNKYLQAYPETNRNIGALPYDWISNFSKNERSEITKQIFKVLTQFSIDTAWVPGIGRLNGYTRVDAKKFEPYYEVFLEKLQKILKRNDIKIKHAGSGSLKNCHRLDVGDYSYALSTFRAPDVTKRGFESFFKQGHGRGYEPQNVFTAYKNCSHGRWAKPFVARVSNDNEKGGYILSVFIDAQKKAFFGQVQKNRDAYINFDEPGNIINNINIDIGGCFANKNYIADSYLRYWCGYFAKMLDNNSALVVDFSDLKVQKYLLQQKQNGVDILSKDFVDNLSNVFDSKGKRSAVKMIKSMKKIRRQKEKLIQSGRFDEIKNKLQQEIDNIYKFDDRKDMFDDFFIKLKNFPRLAADEIGVSHFSSLDGWISMYQKCEPLVNFNYLESRYTKKDIIEFLEKNYEIFRIDENLIDKLSKTFDINNEILKLERKYGNIV